MLPRYLVPVLLSCGLAAACSGGAPAAPAPPVQDSSAPPGATAVLSRVADLGRQLFHDPSLSASGRQSCATCHQESRALAGPDGEVVAAGGAALELTGIRNAPSLRYLAETPSFRIESDGTPVGGFFRDGRANSLAEQARGPLLAANEMANASAAEFADRLRRASYAAEFAAVFGERIFDDPDAVLDRATVALARYQAEDPDFAPFSSKYDAFLAGRVALEPAELRGLALYNDPAKGNCAACHPSARRVNGAPPLFTDFSYDNLGVPRNAAIAANDDPAYFDLGLCGPLRAELATERALCGAFKVPTLRNVALTAPYFHNGRFGSLREVVSFYVRRDTNPEEWYPPDASGAPRKFDDLPAGLAANVNTTEVPYDRRPGDLPALTPAEIDDVVSFLNTLTDGYVP